MARTKWAHSPCACVTRPAAGLILGVAGAQAWGGWLVQPIPSCSQSWCAEGHGGARELAWCSHSQGSVSGVLGSGHDLPLSCRGDLEVLVRAGWSRNLGSVCSWGCLWGMWENGTPAGPRAVVLGLGLPLSASD